MAITKKSLTGKKAVPKKNATKSAQPATKLNTAAARLLPAVRF
jgi:hypothetical protein